MRIVIIASGSRGDVEPYVALGKGLLAAGHIVRLVTHQNFESLVTSHGLDFWPVAGNVQDVAESMAALIESGNFLAILSQMGKEAQHGALALTESSCDHEPHAQRGLEDARGARRQPAEPRGTPASVSSARLRATRRDRPAISTSSSSSTRGRSTGTWT